MGPVVNPVNGSSMGEEDGPVEEAEPVDMVVLVLLNSTIRELLMYQSLVVESIDLVDPGQGVSRS